MQVKCTCILLSLKSKGLHLVVQTSNTANPRTHPAGVCLLLNVTQTNKTVTELKGKLGVRSSPKNDLPSSRPQLFSLTSFENIMRFKEKNL